MTERFHPSLTEDAVRSWITAYLVRNLRLEGDRISMDGEFDRYGLDSAAVMGMVGDFEDHFGIEIDPTIVFEHPTINRLATAVVAGHTRR